MKQPDGPRGLTLQKNLDGVELLFVDERSLIGSNTLGWMEFLCGCGISCNGFVQMLMVCNSHLFLIVLFTDVLGKLLQHFMVL